MKKQTIISKWKLLMTLLLLLTAGRGFSQSNYNCTIDNIVYPTANTLEFDIMISNTGTTSLQLQTFQMGLEFNYTAMANGGTITSSWVPGSSTGLLPLGFQDLTAQAANPMGAALVTSGYRQIRLTAKTGVGSSNGIVMTSTPTKYATMRLTHSATFPAGVTPNFIWSFNTSTGRTKTNFSANVNGNSTGTTLTSPNINGTGGTPHAALPSAPYAYIAGPQHFVNGNPSPPAGCSTAALGTSVSALCFGGNGSVQIIVFPASDGTYSLDGGAAVTFPSGPSFNVSAAQGSHTLDVTPTGCTTPTTINFAIGGPTSNATNTTNATACDTYTWSVNGTTYTASGTYNGTSTDGNGCTVNEVLNLTINASTSSTTNAAACDTYTWACNGTTYTQSGTYTCTNTNAAGCPNTETLNLTINNSTSNSSSATACDTYTWACNGTTYTQSGTYTCVTTNTAGCPNTETLNLTINTSTSGTQTEVACDSYTWACTGATYTQSGTFTCVGTGANGCPSNATLILTINASTSNTTNATACDTYTWSVNGTAYTQSGTYTETSTNAAGCPHVETLNLTINASTSNTTNATACDTYTWSVNGTAYTQSGAYTVTSTNAAGCPHVETLNLTINASTSNTTNATACDTYTWTVNGMAYTMSGTYTETSTNAAGCPHVETLNLTINASTSNTTNATACDTYTWTVNGMTYTQSGIYTETSTNAAGCPNVETLNLTINASTSNTTNATACDTYTWTVNGMTYTQSGTYTETSTNAAGCPNVETLNLTINLSTSNTTSATACDTYTWAIDGNTYTTSGTYTNVTQPAGSNPYCAAGSNLCDEYIENVQFGSIVNASFCSGGYADYTSLSTAVTAGSSYPISILNGLHYTGDQVRVWVDWNQNGLFTDAGETYLITYSNPLSTGAIAVPANAANGNTRMRIRLNYTGAMDPCGNANFGEVEDYTLVVSGGVNPLLCPHTETLVLTINASTSNATTVTSCDTYTWSVDGMTYTATGVYTFTSVNAAGCTHTEILNLTIIPSTTNTSSATACDTYTWSVNGLTYTTSGTYSYTTTGAVAPTYCSAGANTCDEYIENVQFGSIVNASSCSGGYADYTSLSTAVTAGTSYPISILNGLNYPGDQVRVWVDWNQNGLFTDPGETHLITYSNPLSTGTIAVPSGASNGNTRMRIRMNYVGPMDPCGNSSFGEVEDYTLVVSGGVSVVTCPNTEILNLTINNSTSNTTNATACDTYTWSVNGMTYTMSGTYTETSLNAAGCPHVETLNLTINASTSNTTNATACDTYTWSVNGMAYTQSGTYTETSTNAAGCPNVETLNLTINASTSNTSSATACDTYTWTVNGTAYTQSGTYTETSTNAAGCPHVETLNLTINASTSNTTNATACDTYTWSVNGMAYTMSGTYTETSTNAAGCPHVETLNLTINASTSNSSSATACDTYTWAINGMTYTQSGTYTETSTNAAGCPNVETLNLTINASTSNSSSATACDTYTWAINGMTYTQSGTYTETSTNAAGCPHVETLNLTINASTSNSSSATACDTYTWSVNGMTYTTSGTYTETSTNAAGCPHVETLNLTVNISTSNTTTAAACDTYTWSVNGTAYTMSGTYVVTSLNAAGCIHKEILDLTINNSTSNTTNATACDTYTWAINGMTYTQSGTYTETSTNAAGCPHIETLNLTINASTSGTTNATACGTYTWACNGMTYTQSGTYTCSSTNSAGCPNSETLNLTINAATTNTSSATACDSYTWAVNGMTYTQSGTYTFTSTTTSGCTNTEILNLTINNSTSNSSSANACGSYTWACNGVTYTQSGAYTCTSINSAGCTHTETLNLTIDAVSISCPSMSVVSTNGGVCTYQVQDVEFDATTGNCAASSLTYQLTGATTGSGTGSIQTLSDVYLNQGITTVTWTATDAANNSVSCSFTVEVKDNLNSTNYIIYAKEKAEFGESNFIGGDVGVTAANGEAKFKKNTVLDPFTVRAKNIDVNLPSTVNNRVYAPATGGPNPTFMPYSGSITGLSNLSVATNSTVTGNYKDVTVKKGVICTLTGNNFGNITIEEGACVTFTSPVINMIKLEVKNGKKSPYTPTKVMFANPTTVKVKNEVKIGDDCLVNEGGPKVTYYVGSAPTGDGKFEVDGENSKVTGNVVIPKGELRVKGSNDVTRPTIMKGWYVIEKVKSEDKYVYWSQYECGASPKTNVELATTELAKEAVNVYPNPTSSELNVGFTVNELTLTMVKVLDMSGRIVKQVQYTAEEGLNTITMNISDLNTGVYTLQLSSKDEVLHVTRIVKN